MTRGIEHFEADPERRKREDVHESNGKLLLAWFIAVAVLIAVVIVFT